MVVLVHKVDEKNQFMYETSVTKPVDEVVDDIVDLCLSLHVEHIIAM